MDSDYAETQSERNDLLRRHREVSEALNRAVLALLTFSLFCWLTAVGSPDRSLIVNEPTVEVPFIDVTLSFPAFLIVAPFLLIVFTIYLHVFYQERLRLEAELGGGTSGRAVTLFNINDLTARLLASFILYWLVPLTLGAIRWKALARLGWGVPMLLLITIVTAVLGYVQHHRSPDKQQDGMSPRPGVLYGMVALAINLGIIVTASLAPLELKRPFNLYRAKLEDAWLLGADLTGANLRFANLAQANLSQTILRGADLHGANLRDARNLDEAFMDDAELAGVDLAGVDLSGAFLIRAKLNRANLAGTIFGALI